MDKLKEFYLCTRPHSYPAAIAPVLLGTVFAFSYASNIYYGRFILFLLACLFIQAATNLFNEYYDYKRGLDKEDSLGISGSIVKGKLKAKSVLYGAIVLYICAFILGIILTLLTNIYVLLVGLICMIVGYLYTGGKYPIAYSPFGEVVAGFFMGTVIICLAFYFQTEWINKDVVIISLPLFLLIGAILLANNIRDLDNDKISGRKTYAILVGRQKAIVTLRIMFILVYIFNIYFSFISYGSIFNLLVFVTVPLANKIVRGFKNNTTKEGMAPYMVMTAKLTILVGFLMSIAYILKIFF